MDNYQNIPHFNRSVVIYKTRINNKSPVEGSYCDSDGARTHDPQLRRLLL